MKQRGRRSATDLATQGAVTIVARPDVPLDLTPEEGDVWQAIVDAMPADWFAAETWPLLRQYCRHTVAARRVAQLIDQAASRKEVDVSEMKDLLSMQKQESAALKALAASMRLSQQASYHHEKAGVAKKSRTTVKRPWES